MALLFNIGGINRGVIPEAFKEVWLICVIYEWYLGCRLVEYYYSGTMNGRYIPLSMHVVSIC